MADMLDRADAARRLIAAGADPALMLSYVISPTPAIEEAFEMYRHNGINGRRHH